MIGVSNDYKRQLIAGNRNYVIKVDVFLNGNVTATPDFTLENEDIWDNGIVLDEATSNDDSFDIGCAIVGSLKVVIDNITENYTQYYFYDARLVLWLGVTGDEDALYNQRYYRLGFFTVDKPTYNGSLITLECFDNMTWFDTPFGNITGLTYPITAGNLVYAICTHCGVTLGTPTFPNYTTQITVEPEGSINCREVLQYVAQMCCCYCKIDTAGELNLKWYNKYEIININDIDGGSYHTTTTPYSDGDNVDGGAFMTGGDSADGGTFADLMNGAYLSKNYDINVSTEDIVVTGCRVVNNTDTEDSYDELWVDSTLEQTHDRYVLVIENNPLITSANASTIASTVGNILAGLPIRGFTATSLNDMSYETGDMVTIYDFRGHFYRTWITHFTFTTNNSERFSCGVQSVRERSETRFSGTVKTLAEANKNADNLLTEYDTAVKELNELAQNSLGYNKYEFSEGGATTTWLYSGHTVDNTNPSAPVFPSSTNVIKISGDGVFISHDGGLTYDSGYDANSGTAILSLLYAQGLSSEWIKTGTLDVGGLNNIDGIIRVTNRSNVATINVENTDTNNYFFVGRSQIPKSGTYKVYYEISNVEAGKPEKIWYQIQYRHYDSDTSSYVWTIVVPWYKITAHSGVLPYDFVVDENDGNTYYYVSFSRSVTTNASFTVTATYDKINTIIDNSGITTSNISITGGSIRINKQTISDSNDGLYLGSDGIALGSDNKFKVLSDGTLTADSGTIAGYTINHPVYGHGLYYNSGGVYAEYSVNKMHIGSLVNNSYWTFCATANGGEFLHLDYGSSNVGGLWITGNGANNIWDFSGGAMHITKSSVSCDAHGEVQWSGSDKKLKKNIKKLTLKKAKDLIFSVLPREFEMKYRKGKRYGFVAQELRETLSDDSGIEFESNGIRNINYNDFIAPLCLIVKSQQEEIDLLKQEIALLKEKVGG